MTARTASPRSRWFALVAALAVLAAGVTDPARDARPRRGGCQRSDRRAVRAHVEALRRGNHDDLGAIARSDLEHHGVLPGGILRQRGTGGVWEVPPRGGGARLPRDRWVGRGSPRVPRALRLRLGIADVPVGLGHRRDGPRRGPRHLPGPGPEPPWQRPVRRPCPPGQGRVHRNLDGRHDRVLLVQAVLRRSPDPRGHREARHRDRPRDRRGAPAPRS